jgi:hypothetical protein
MSEDKAESPENEASLPAGWTKEYSKTHQKHYYFCHTNGKTSWTMPSDEEDVRSGASSSSNPTPQKTAVIVPFRDLHKSQKRKEHLDTFIPAMSKYLSQANVPFKIFIVEQSDDGRKFNRGKLLNIGFKYAEAQKCTTFIFHDVDLLPSDELRPWYVSMPSNPAHIARVWNRYSDNPRYFGGVVSFTRDQYRKINGFPNNFWGWGGEDDEMYRRVVQCKLTPIHPSEGSFTDLEGMSLDTKLKFLKQNPTWKCMNKNEVLEESAIGTNWRHNGLSTLAFKELSVSRPSTANSSSSGGSDSGRYCDIVKVDVLENSHWTDLVCKVDDVQYDQTVEGLKSRFAALQGAKSGGGEDVGRKRKLVDTLSMDKA